MNSRNKNNCEYKKAILALSGGIIGIGTGPVFVRLINLEGNIVAFYRFLFAFLIISLLVLKKNGGNEFSLSGDIIKWVIIGGLSFALNIFLWSNALTMAPVATVTLLDNTAPVWVGIGSVIFFKEKKGWLYWVGLITTITGAMLLILNQKSFFYTHEGLGTILGFLSGLIYAVYLLVSQYIRKFLDTITYVWFITLIGAISLAIGNFLFGVFNTNLSLKEFILILIMTLTSQVVGWLLINYAIGFISVSKVSIALLGQPLISSFLAAIIFDEIPSIFQTIGGFICLYGIYLVQRSNTSQDLAES